MSQIDIIRVFKTWCKALGFVSRTSDATRLRGRVWRMTGGGQSVCVSPLSLLPLYLPLPLHPLQGAGEGGTDSTILDARSGPLDIEELLSSPFHAPTPHQSLVEQGGGGELNPSFVVQPVKINDNNNSQSQILQNA